MEHTFFALFPDVATAEKALDELLASELCREEHVSVVVHRDADPERFADLIVDQGDNSETDALPNAVRGALLGGLLGAVVIGPLGLIGMGPVAAVLLGALLGTGPGAFTGAMVGFGFPDHRLRKLIAEIESGNTLLTVHADSLEREREVERMLERHGARLAERVLR
jgi:uncharacterized membrane protein